MGESDILRTSSKYWVTMVVMHLGWVDSDLKSSSCCWATTAAIYCPTRGWKFPNLSQPNPGAQPPWSPCIIPDSVSGEHGDGGVVRRVDGLHPHLEDIAEEGDVFIKGLSWNDNLGGGCCRCLVG